MRLTDALPDSFERVLALIGLGAAEHWDGRHESGEARMNEAVEVAERMGSDLAMAHALNGWVSVRTSSPADELPERRRALALARACGSVDQIVNGTIWLMNALEGELRFEEAADVGRQGFEEASRLGELNWSYFVAAGAASNLVALGRWSEARSLLREALTVRCVGVPGALARLVAADLALGEGDVDAAEKHVTRALEVVDPDFGGLRADLICVLAEVRVAQGRPGEAVAWIRERLDVGGPAPADDIDLELFICLVQAITEVIREARSREDRVAEKVAEGELAQWLEVFTARLPVLAERDLHSRSTRLLRAFAELARSRGDADEVQRWEQLARRAKELGLQRREAYALLRLSEALVADGAPRATLAPTLRRLHLLASGMGATRFREEAEALARIARVSLAPVRLPRQTGSADTSEKRSEVAGLTAREQEILAHLVAGRTNAEIAKSLVISDKTVSVHVSNILRKTGTSSRTQIPAPALRLA